jgi:hypothetical protein
MRALLVRAAGVAAIVISVGLATPGVGVAASNGVGISSTLDVTLTPAKSQPSPTSQYQSAVHQINSHYQSALSKAKSNLRRALAKAHSAGARSTAVAKFRLAISVATNDRDDALVQLGDPPSSGDSGSSGSSGDSNSSGGSGSSNERP